MIKVLDNCTSCKRCISLCPFNCIKLVNSIAFINDSCNECGLCVDKCQEKAIVKCENKSNELKEYKSGYKGICIFTEHNSFQLNDTFKELVTHAFELKKKLVNRKISAILIGDNVNEIADGILNYGIDEVWISDGQNLSHFNEDVIAHLAAKIIERQKPEIFLGLATEYGRSIFPLIATKLKTGLTADCIAIDIEEESEDLVQIRPTYGGSKLAAIKTKKDYRPQMATIREGVIVGAKQIMNKIGKKIFIDDVPSLNSKYQLIKVKKQLFEISSIESSKIVVGIGMGAQSPNTLNLVKEFAEKINASLGATRAVIEAGILDENCQIGQTGKIINPDVYIALGISGAIQHQVGVLNAKSVIAVNINPNAPIFKIANCGIIGDVFEVISELLCQMKN